MTRLFCMTTAAATILLGGLGCTGHLGEEGSRVDSLGGSLGDATFAGTPELREVRIDRNEVYLDLRLQDEAAGWAVMVGVTIPRDRSAEDVGSTTLALRPEDADLVGCSGPDDGDWDFDCKPDDLSVSVDERGDSVRVDFDGWFSADTCLDLPDDAPDQNVEGSVDLI